MYPQQVNGQRNCDIAILYITTQQQKEQTVDTHNNLNGSQKHFDK